MKISDFVNRYYLHDSYFESVKYDNNNHILYMVVNFAYWMQDWYNDSMPENGRLSLIFNNVSEYFIDDAEVNCETMGIVKATADHNNILIVLDDIEDNYYQMHITAESVDIGCVTGDDSF